MRIPSCEEIRVAAMALADGEQASLDPEEVRGHLAACPGCRREIEEVEALVTLLARQTRRLGGQDLWPGIAERLPETSAAPRAGPAHPPIWLLTLLLGAYKLIEFVPDRSWPLLVQLTPAAIAAGWLLWSKQNPFRVDAELWMEGGGES